MKFLQWLNLVILTFVSFTSSLVYVGFKTVSMQSLPPLFILNMTTATQSTNNPILDFSRSSTALQGCSCYILIGTGAP